MLQHSYLIFHLLLAAAATTTMLATNSSISYIIEPYILVFKNSTLKRLSETTTVPATHNDKATVWSEDIYISRKPTITARLYRPRNSTAKHKLPLLVYFHGGAFFTSSAFSPTYHNLINSLVAKANILAVSVNYRLAPENPLPAGYNDSWQALQWVFSLSIGNNGVRGGGAWLRNQADFEQVYLGGDGAGGNIAQDMAIRVGLDMADGIKLNGMFLIFPYFWGKKRVGNESEYPKKEAWVESIWAHAYPGSKGLDDPLLNPGKDTNLARLGCKSVLVFVAEKGILRDRGLYYWDLLKEVRWNGRIDVVKVKAEDSFFNLKFPDDPKARIILEKLAVFLDQGRIPVVPTWPTPAVSSRIPPIPSGVDRFGYRPGLGCLFFWGGYVFTFLLHFMYIVMLFLCE